MEDRLFGKPAALPPSRGNQAAGIAPAKNLSELAPVPAAASQ